MDISMKLRTYRYFFKQGIKNMLRNKSLAVVSMVSIAAALFVLGVIVSVVFNLEHILSGIESRMEVTVFLESGTTFEEISDTEKRIKEMRGIIGVEFVSRHEALKAWKEELGQWGSLLEGYTVENNPLPDYFIIKVAQTGYVEGIAEFAETLKSVERVSYSKPVVDFIKKLSSILRLGGAILVAILLFITVLIMSNTIRVAVFSRKKEIGIMKFIGATDWFIRLPFVVEGLILGLVGAIVSASLILGVYYFVYMYTNEMLLGSLQMHFLSILNVQEIAYPIIYVFLPLGSIIGVLASTISIRKHLRV